MKETSDASLGMHILEVEITTRCNLNCQHCYNRTLKPVDFPVDTFKDLYRFADEHSVWTFIVSGGEAILHQRFKEIVSFIRHTPHNFRLVLQSNGTMLTENRWDDLRAFDLIHLSFDPVEDVRKNGARNLMLAKYLRDAGINTYVFTTIHRNNRGLIGRMVEEATGAGVPIGFNICIPVERIDATLLMTRSEFMETERELHELYAQGKILRYSSPLVALLDEEKPGSFERIRGGCAAGIAACVISPIGECYPCPFFRVSAGNLFTTPIEKIWNESPLFNCIRDRTAYHEPCGSCEHLAFCGGCRNRAYRANGDLQGPDPMCYKDLLKKGRSQ